MTLAIASLYFFDPANAGERQRREAQKSENARRRESHLYCARCQHVVTDATQRIEVNGASAHTCTNPHGITFHITCFRTAPGCTAPGASTTEYTWFAGYAWRIAYCGQCGTHLGWLFTSSAEGFYGLIVDRLTSAG